MPHRLRLLLLSLSALLLLALAGSAQAAPPRAALFTDLVGGGSGVAFAGDTSSRNMRLLASSPKTDTVNSDLAFWGRLAAAGNYDGFRLIDISDPQAPVVLSDFYCHGRQGDISIWGNLLFQSVDQPQTSVDCNSVDAVPVTAPTAFEGIRIFDISDPSHPLLIRGVAADCGSHTHTLVPDLAHNRILVYVSSYALRSGPHCGPGQEDNPLHGKISIVSVPLDHPENAYVISTPPVTPPVFDLGPPFNPTQGCHDITVFLPLHLAAAACLSDGELWDISDPVHPRTLEAIHVENPGIEIWHSSAFTWDGTYVIWGDESESGSCNGDQTEMDGRVWFYPLSNPTVADGSFLIPRDQLGDYCSAHLFNVVPVRGRYLLASSWYGGGVDVVDFTNPSAANELGYYDVADGSFWSAYWYNNFIYGNDIPNGFDVFLFSDRARAGAQRFGHLNPQTQESYLR